MTQLRALTRLAFDELALGTGGIRQVHRAIADRAFAPGAAKAAARRHRGRGLRERARRRGAGRPRVGRARPSARCRRRCSACSTGCGATCLRAAARDPDDAERRGRRDAAAGDLRPRAVRDRARLALRRRPALRRPPAGLDAGLRPLQHRPPHLRERARAGRRDRGARGRARRRGDRADRPLDGRAGGVQRLPRRRRLDAARLARDHARLAAHGRAARVGRPLRGGGARRDAGVARVRVPAAPPQRRHPRHAAGPGRPAARERPPLLRLRLGDAATRTIRSRASSATGWCWSEAPRIARRSPSTSARRTTWRCSTTLPCTSG